MLTNEAAERIVDDLILLAAEKLTTWELEFIDNMNNLSEFTDAQLIKIEELEEEYL